MRNEHDAAFTARDRHENFMQTRHEARVAMLGWICALVWTVGVSWWLGQEQPAPLLFGIPRWVLIGVALPWVATLAFNTWYSAVLLARNGPPGPASNRKAGGA